MTEMLCRLFREEGYEADAAEDGDVAVKKVQMKEFQLVILNIRMPRMDGLEALPLIKTYSPTTKVIMYSGNCSPENNAKAKRLGASASVLKPASNAEILDTVRKVLQGQAT
jgi:DNA-binding response OmpR family regulator